MRNWNLQENQIRDLKEFSFHSTYEELKQIKVRYKESQYGSFHSTYEELKPGKMELGTAFDLCFHSTYEELKLEIHQETMCREVSVFILPMRNWNKEEVKVISSET